jgi:queuine tRNA-ribosyltransferase
VMGLGDAEGMLDAIALGIDLFDCVIPTRLARHGKALTRFGDVSVKRQTWNDDGRPLDEACPCIACTRYSRAYLRHLHRTKELLGHRLLTLHNLTYVYGLMAQARHHIVAGSFAQWRREVMEVREHGFDRPER